MLGNFMHTWNYRDNRDNKQNYRDRRISVIAQPYLNISLAKIWHESFVREDTIEYMATYV